MLVEACDADVNHVRNGLTPLHLAATYDHAEAARLLLSYGADASIVDVELRRAARSHTRVLQLHFNSRVF